MSKVKSKTPINTKNVAEVITSLVMIYSGKTINFDAVYGYVKFYIDSADSPTLEGLVAAIREGDFWGRDFMSNIKLPTDVNN